MLALFVPTLDGGGAERVMVTLAGAFAARDLRVELLVAKAVGPWLERLDPAVELRELGGMGVLAALPRLVAYLRRERPAALLSTLDHANLVAVWARALAGGTTRVVLREAANPADRILATFRDRAVDRLLARGYRRADAVVALAEAMKASLVHDTGLDARRVTVVPNPVPVDEVRRAAASEPDHPWFAERAPVIVAAGRLTGQKDFATLLRAFATLPASAEARLAVLGEGPERPALESLARELGVAERVALPGFRANPYPWYRRAAVVALSSRFEGMPNVLLEAMALGRPVVATDCPTGPAEVLEGGRLGRLVPVGDADALAVALAATLAGDHAPASALRAAAERHRLPDVADRYLEILGLERLHARAA